MSASSSSSYSSSSSALVDFSGQEVAVEEPGVYTVYRRESESGEVAEVQAHFR